MATNTPGPARPLPRAHLALALALTAGVFVVACSSQEKDREKTADTPKPAFGAIERLDPRFDKLIPRDAAIEKLADGFDWAEGPLWIKDGYGDTNYLLFSDVPRNVVYKWKPGKRGVTEFLKP